MVPHIVGAEILGEVIIPEEIAVLFITMEINLITIMNITIEIKIIIIVTIIINQTTEETIEIIQITVVIIETQEHLLGL